VSRTITDPRNRVSSVYTVHALPRSLRFVSGGMDGTKHAIRLWEVNRDLTPKSSELLEVKHTAAIRALLPTGPIGNKLLSGGDDRTVNAYDVAGKKNIITVKCSNKIHHIHPTSQHDSILVEVILKWCIYSV
jgi:WD40 repeat protein